MAAIDTVNQSVGVGLSPEDFIPDPPSEDWELNILLDDIAQGITEEDLKRLKSYCIGGPGKRTLSEMKDAMDLFTHLRQTRRLTRDNLIVLQSMLFHIHRRDLQKKVVEYARRLGNVLHFYTPSDSPENGYQHLTIHVEGTVNFDRIKLEKLRDGVARLLCIPARFVVVDGLQPGNSFLITFTIAEDYIDFVIEIQQGDADFLISEGVDYVKVNEKAIDLKSLQKEQSTEDMLSIHHEMQSFTKRIQDLEADLDHTQAEMIKVERERKWYKSENSTFKQTLQNNVFIAFMVQTLWFYVLYIKTFKPFERLSTKAACAYFHAMLKETQRLNYDSNVLRALMEANVMMIKAKVSEDMCIGLAKYKFQIHAMASKINFLEYEKEKLAFYLNIGEHAPILSQREEFWLRTLERSYISPGIPMSGVISATIKLSDPDLHIILTKLSKELAKKERNILLQGLSDGERRKIEKSPNTLLQSLWEKEKRMSIGRTNLDIWFQAIMKEINRQDLNNRFHEMVKTTIIQRPSEEKKPKLSSTSSRSPGLHKSLGRRKRRRFNSGPGTPGIIHTDSEQSSGFGDMEEENESSFTQFQILSKQMQKVQTELETLNMKSKEEFQFSPFTKDTESAFSSIPSYISKPKI